MRLIYCKEGCRQNAPPVSLITLQSLLLMHQHNIPGAYRVAGIFVLRMMPNHDLFQRACIRETWLCKAEVNAPLPGPISTIVSLRSGVIALIMREITLGSFKNFVRNVCEDNVPLLYKTIFVENLINDI